MRPSTRLFILTLIVFSVTVLGCRKPTESAQETESREWDRFVSAYIESYFAANPEIAVLAGRHEFDGKLPDWSEAGIAREVQRLKTERARALRFGVAGLDDRRRFERDYLVARITGELFWLDEAKWPFRNPKFYSDLLDPNVYVSREYAPLPTRLRAYLTYARNIPRVANEIRANLRLPLPKPYIQIGRLGFGGFAAYYEKDVPTVFASVNDLQLQAEFRDANAQAIRAMKDLDAWLGAQEASATNDFAIGADMFRDMVNATEGVDVSLDALADAGRRDLDRNVASLREACAKYAPGDDLRRCIDKVRVKKPEGGPVEGARRQLATLKAFIAENSLASIPGTEQALVAESPPYQRWNFAYIDIPGPYDKGVPSTYYIAPPDPAWSKAEQLEYIPGEADLLFTSVHEVWPGHFLQYLHANRAASKFGQIFVGYAFAEGWAHYAEEMMWDAGLGAGNPEIHIGQLLNALLRNARFLSAIGMHTGNMTQAQSETLFREHGYQDAGTAKQQAARGTFDPAYLNYTMGKLVIRKLRDDWTASRGGREAWREFHDKFLEYGGPPIPLVRKAMLGPNAGPPL